MTAPARIHPAAEPPPVAPWRWAQAGLVLGSLAALTAFAPARWLAASIAQASQGRVLLQAPEGTIWKGSARLALSAGAGSRQAVTLPSRVQWQVRLMPGGASVSVMASCCTAQPIELALRPGWRTLALHVRNGPASHWPASMLTGLGAPWNTIAPEGDLALETQGLTWHLAPGEATMSGQAQLTAQRLVSRLSMGRPLGSYRLMLAGGSPMTLQVQTLEGDLQLTGAGQRQAGRWRFEGQAQASAGREEAMSNLLNVIGRRQGDRSIIRIG